MLNAKIGSITMFGANLPDSRPTKHMKITHLLLLGCFITATFFTTAFALTVDEQVTPAYLREHINEFSVKVTKDKNGLLAFTVVHTLSKPMYLIQRLTVHHAGKIIAENSNAFVTHQRENTFYFSLSPEDIAASEFEISHCPGFQETDYGVTVVPGTLNYQFHLRDFVPEELLNHEPAK
jgi:hypothetical protein